MSYKKRLEYIDKGINIVLSNMFDFGDLTPKENMEILRKLIMRIPPHNEQETLVKNEFLDSLNFYTESIKNLSSIEE